MFVVAALLAGTVALAADTPNFTGTWTMDVAKSDFGGRPAPDKMERKIKQTGDLIEMSTTVAGQMGETTRETKYAVDGKEYINKAQFGDVKSVLSWEGKVLVVNSKLEFQGAEIKITDKWALSADGKAMTVDSTIETPQGLMNQKVVLNKAGEKK
jgi:hypothetical protein